MGVYLAQQPYGVERTLGTTSIVTAEHNTGSTAAEHRVPYLPQIISSWPIINPHKLPWLIQLSVVFVKRELPLPRVSQLCNVGFPTIGFCLLSGRLLQQSDFGSSTVTNFILRGIPRYGEVVNRRRRGDYTIV